MSPTSMCGCRRTTPAADVWRATCWRRSPRPQPVRVRNGELLVPDGPFAEIKEVIVGYDLLECADLDEAIEVARRHPMARGGRLELCPFADLNDRPRD